MSDLKDYVNKMPSIEIEELESVFPTRSVADITPAFVCANEKDEESIKETRDFFGKNWKEVTPEDFEKNIAAISFFTPEAFAYFLPALIRCSQLLYQKVSLSVEKVLSNLDGQFLGELKSWQRDYWEEFTGSQLKLISKWLEWLSVCENEKSFLELLEVANQNLRKKAWQSW